MEQTYDVDCPWCGEQFTTFLDPSITSQSYIEDCQVCCRPIQINVDFSAGVDDPSVRADRS